MILMQDIEEVSRLQNTFLKIIPLSKKIVMKNKAISIRLEEALIYKNKYKPSLNLLKFFRAILLIFVSGQSVGATRHHYRKK